MKNVLIIGDSVSAGYHAAVGAALASVANVQHGPDNAGGGNADGSFYGKLCVDYFVRTPLHTLPPWDVITYNFGLHDGVGTETGGGMIGTSIANYTAVSLRPVGGGRCPFRFASLTDAVLLDSSVLL
jgi:hypothetical protein